jgi:hypothetical protein
MSAVGRQGVVERHPDFKHLPAASTPHLKRGVLFFKYDFKMAHFKKARSRRLSLGL